MNKYFCYFLMLVMSFCGAFAGLFLKKGTDKFGTVVMPMMSLTYIWTTVLSVTILKEQLTVRKILGLAFIVAGVITIIL